MSLLTVVPDVVSVASGNLEKLGSALRTANTAAASQTTAIAAPAADEVSAAITALFGTHAQEFQALSAKAAVFHEGFVNVLNGGAAHYLSTEIANARQTLVNASPGTGHAAGAAANSVQATVSNVKNFNFGPLELSLSQSVVPLAGGGTRQAANALVALNTPLGRVGLWQAGALSVQTAHAASAVAYISTPVGPLDLLLSQHTATLAGGGTVQAVNATVAVDTLLGRAGLWAVGGSATQTGNAASAIGYVSSPVGPVELSLGETNVPLADGGFRENLHAATSLITPLGRVGLVGPLELSVSGSPLPTTGGAFHGAWSANGTLNTPVGPVELLSGAATANIPANGPVLLAAHGAVPGLGHLDFAMKGTSSSSPSGLTLQFTGATLIVPPAFQLLAAEAGPYVLGGNEIVNNTIGVASALSRGNLAGAAGLYFSSPIAFADAVLFGQETINIPLGTGPNIGGLHIPFGGVFAPLRPITVEVPMATSTDSSTDTTLTLLGSAFSVHGTEFGGIVPTLLNSIVSSL
jgi:PE family